MPASFLGQFTLHLKETAMERAAIGDTTLAYEITGTGEPVVFIHGALVADSFRPLLTETSTANQYQLITYHRRGYGESDHGAGVVSIADQAEDCVALLRHLNLGPVHVVGHSYGGAIALHLTLDHPDMVHSLALLEPALIVGESGPEYRKSLAQGGELYRSVETETLVHQFLLARWSDYRETLDRVLPGAFAQAVLDAETAFEYELSSLLDWQFTETEARRIQQPTLSVLGGDSNAFSPRFDEVHQILQQWIPNAEGITIPGVTHFLTIQDPEAVLNGLVGFWKRHPFLREPVAV
jgi:pimeloyl-ACP methyl ester carboxylesterase